MGRIKHLNKVRDLFKKTPVVSARDIRLIVKNDDYTYLLIRNLIKRGEINRIKKGYYSLYDDPMVSVFCYKPGYIGLQNALSIHNLWEQETNVVIVTAKKVRSGTREIFGNNVVIHSIRPELLFGYDLIRYGDFHIPVSDIEKTFLDLLYFNRLPDDKILGNIRNRIDTKKINNYLKVYPEKFNKRVRKLI